jgi:hypothetical protein
MDASHVLLGRPWQYDVDTTHKGRENRYSFTWNKLKIIRLPNKASSIASEVGEKSMLSIAQNANEFVEDMKESKMCAALIVKGDEQPTEEIPMEIQSLLSEYQSILGELRNLSLTWPPLMSLVSFVYLVRSSYHLGLVSGIPTPK